MTKRLQVYGARVALEKLDTSKRLRRASLARSRRTPPSANVKLGDAVYSFREGRRKNRRRRGPALLFRARHGPAVVIGAEPSAFYAP